MTNFDTERWVNFDNSMHFYVKKLSRVKNNILAKNRRSFLAAPAHTLAEVISTKNVSRISNSNLDSAGFPSRFLVKSLICRGHCIISYFLSRTWPEKQMTSDFFRNSTQKATRILVLKAVDFTYSHYFLTANIFEIGPMPTSWKFFGRAATLYYRQ